MNSLKAHMLKRLYYTVVALATAAFIFAVGYNLEVIQPPETIKYGTPAQIMKIREHAPQAPNTVLSQHEGNCWGKGEKPMAPIPNAAIVQFNDGVTVYTEKPSLVSPAYNEALANAGHDAPKTNKFDVIALCV